MLRFAAPYGVRQGGAYAYLGIPCGFAQAPHAVRALILGMCVAGAVGSYSNLLTETSLQAQGRRRQQVGRQDDGSIVVTTNQILTPAGRQVEFRGRPLAVTLSPDGRTAAFLNGTYQAIT